MGIGVSVLWLAVDSPTPGSVLAPRQPRQSAQG